MTTFSPVAGDAVWMSADYQDPAKYTVSFSDDELAELGAMARKAKSQGTTVENVEASFYDWPAVQAKMTSLLPVLKSGRGFFILGELPEDRFDKEDMALICWGLGGSIGACTSQSAKGDRLGHLRDMSAVDPNVRAYQNRNKLNAHTDFTEVVGLMCLRDAKTGGETPVSSALAVHNRIGEERPDLYEILCRGFRYHRRGEQQPGEPNLTDHRVPVFSRKGDTVSCRFIRPYIEGAAQELGVPLTDAEVEALDLVQSLADSDEFRLDLRLAPGTMVLFNNYTMLHSRRPFTDHQDEDRKRHLLRMWLLPEDFRETVPEIEIFSTKGGIQKSDISGSSFNWGVGGQ